MDAVPGSFPGYRLKPQYQYLISNQPSGAGRIVTDDLGRPSSYKLATFYLGNDHPEFSEAAHYSRDQKCYPGQYFPARGY